MHEGRVHRNISTQLPDGQTVEEAYDIAAALIAEGAIPQQAKDDAMHVALAAVHGVDYLLTWNCRHIDNAETKPVVQLVCATHGHDLRRLFESLQALQRERGARVINRTRRETTISDSQR